MNRFINLYARRKKFQIKKVAQTLLFISHALRLGVERISVDAWLKSNIEGQPCFSAMLSIV